MRVRQGVYLMENSWESLVVRLYRSKRCSRYCKTERKVREIGIMGEW